MDIDRLTDDILRELKEEEKQMETKRLDIVKNGCPCLNKIERISSISRIHFLECEICYKQFDLKGNENST